MILQFKENEVEKEVARLTKAYDIVRLVDPEECHAFTIGEDNSYEYGPSCYSVWRKIGRAHV